MAEYEALAICMISYELAQELKDSGFPQEERHWYYCTFTYPTTLWCINALEAKKLDELYECMTAAPTLSELIDECGDSLFLWQFENRWYAAICDPDDNLGEWSSNHIDISVHSENSGSSPEEAVASLLLARNKTPSRAIKTID